MNIHDKLDYFNDNEIAIELPKVGENEKTTVRYNGLLTNKGAEKVYLHYGFDNWTNTNTVPMSKSSRGSYTTEIKVKGKDSLEFCFKDNANNWDNNNGSNWSVDIR